MDDEVHFLARVYLNGEMLYNFCKHYWNYDNWKNFNRQQRRAAALFINGEHVENTGVLKADQIKQVEEKLKTIRTELYVDGVEINFMPSGDTRYHTPIL